MLIGGISELEMGIAKLSNRPAVNHFALGNRELPIEGALHEIVVRARENAAPGGIWNLLESFRALGPPGHSSGVGLLKRLT